MNELSAGALVVVLVMALAAVAMFLFAGYQRWQYLAERERFLLGLKKASRPKDLQPNEISRLSILRSPWWALWRWLPDYWRRSS